MLRTIILVAASLLPSVALAGDAMKHAPGDACYRSGLSCDCRTGLCEGHDGYGEAVAMSAAVSSWRAMERAVKAVGCAPALTWSDRSVTFNRACIARLGPRWRRYASGYEINAYGELKPGDIYFMPGAD